MNLAAGSVGGTMKHAQWQLCKPRFLEIISAQKFLCCPIKWGSEGYQAEELEELLTIILSNTGLAS